MDGIGGGMPAMDMMQMLQSSQGGQGAPAQAAPQEMSPQMPVDTYTPSGE